MRQWIRSLFKALDEFFASPLVDGLDTSEYVGAIEEHFGVHFNDETLASMKTLGDLCDQISRRLPQSAELSPEAVWHDVREITSREMGVDAGDLNAGTRFVEDLSC